MHTIASICKEISQSIKYCEMLQDVTVTCLVKKISVYPYMVYVDIVDCDNNTIQIAATINNHNYNNDININDKLIINGKIEFYKNISLKVITYEHDTPVESSYERICRELRQNDIFQLPKKKLEKLRNIAVISSSNAAGLKDFLDVIFSTSINNVYVISVTLQGYHMEESVLNGLSLAKTLDVDAIIIIRGGGSRTDLEWFDNYNIAVSVKTSPIITICGIGHEIDHSVIDDVADYSFNTPTQVSYFIRDILLTKEKRIEYLIGTYWKKVNDLCDLIPKINNTLDQISSDRLDKLEKVILLYDGKVDYLLKLLTINNDSITEKINTMLSNLHQYDQQLTLLSQNSLLKINSNLTTTIINKTTNKTMNSKTEMMQAKKNGDQIVIQFVDGFIII